MPWSDNRDLIKKIMNPSPTVQYNSQIPRVLSMLPEGARKLDLGAGGRKITADTLAVDFVKTGDTDIVADIHKVPLRDESIDCIFCTGTLEHVEYPETVVKEMVRALKKDGIVYIDVPFMQCFHPDPVDYWRFTLKGLELLCQRNGFDMIESGANIGMASSLTWVMMVFLQNIFPSKFLNKCLGRFLSIVVAPFKYLDKFLIRRKDVNIAASAVYFIGRKK